MRIALISDIHANAEALSSVLDDIDQRAIDSIVCLGDIVGYGPDPAACLDVIRSRSIMSFMGNHDQAAFDADLRTTFSQLARAAIEWTAPRLDAGDVDFLRSLAYRDERNGATFVHAAPSDPHEFEYIMDDVDAARHFRGFTTAVCFVGHTHQPDVFPEDLGRRRVEAGRRFIVNVGSVGQPRDGNPQACYGLFDSEAVSFEHVRVSYDVAATAEKIYLAGLPAQLADRLVLGI